MNNKLVALQELQITQGEHIRAVKARRLRAKVNNEVDVSLFPAFNKDTARIFFRYRWRIK